MFNIADLKGLIPQKVTTPAPIQEIAPTGPKTIVIGSVKHLMAAAQVTKALEEAAKLEAIKLEQEAKLAKIEAEAIPEPKKEFKVDPKKDTKADIQAVVEAKPEVVLKKPEFKPFQKFMPKPAEKPASTESLPKNISTWFMNNLSNLMNGLPVENEVDFFTLMNKLSEDDNLNPPTTHNGLAKIKHFVKTKMTHMFDINKDEFITFNLPSLDKGTMLLGPTPDNNIVLAGNLSSLVAEDWDTLHQSLEKELKLVE
jgi:hypothetical protein